MVTVCGACGTLCVWGGGGRFWLWGGGGHHLIRKLSGCARVATLASSSVFVCAKMANTTPQWVDSNTLSPVCLVSLTTALFQEIQNMHNLTGVRVCSVLFKTKTHSQL